MKKAIFIILLLLSCSTIIYSCKNDDEQISEIYNGDLEITRLEDINAFTFKVITGNLTISFADDITSLEGLSSLTSVGGNLRIFGNQFLRDLGGLENLVSVGQGLDIYYNASLVSLKGLENVTYIGSDLYIGDNDELNTLNGLEHITSIDGYLIIINNGSLISLSGLDGLASVGNYLWITGNKNLASLSGLDNLTSVSLSSTGKGSSYASLDKSILVNTDEIIPSVSKRTIHSPHGFFSISNNSVLKSLSSLNKLTTIGGSLFIENNATLESLNGLENLITVNNNLRIGNDSFSRANSYAGNSSLTDLCAIRHLIVNGQIAKNEYYVYYNFYNPTYNEIQNKDTCLKGTTYTGHLFLDNQEDVDNFNYTRVNGDLTIYSWGKIKNLNGLKTLTSVSGYVNIGNNTSLSSLSGLDNLTSVGKDFSVYFNDALTNLNGLNSITSVGENLKVYENKALTNLCGMRQLITNGQISSDEYKVNENAYNPSYEEIQNIGSTGCEE